MSKPKSKQTSVARGMPTPERKMPSPPGFASAKAVALIGPEGIIARSDEPVRRGLYLQPDLVRRFTVAARRLRIDRDRCFDQALKSWTEKAKAGGSASELKMQEALAVGQLKNFPRTYVCVLPSAWDSFRAAISQVAEEDNSSRCALAAIFLWLEQHKLVAV